ncbi:MAG: glycosyltransferase family 39 protein [Candidatus Omnitrophica bacterium]|nr:glycosyltransferase family 39 protein [Candidatus Omnitrophota bacterium]
MMLGLDRALRDDSCRNIFIFFVIVVAFALRLFMASRVPLIHDEDQWIGLADQCSMAQGQFKLVFHGYQHPVLPVYLIKLSTVFFGDNLLGYRILNICAGVLTIWMVYLMALRWFGVQAALLSAVFLAFNEYHIGISAFAIEKSFYLLFASITLYYFYKAIDENDPKRMVLAGVYAGLSFLCKEIAFLLLIVFFIYLLFSERRDWLKKKTPYVALLVFFVVISPDIYWNLVNTAPDHDGFVNYADHLKRVSQLGFSVYPFAFYFFGLFNTFLTDLGIWRNDSPEYPGLNSIWGALCFLGVIFSVYDRKHDFKKLLLYVFFVIFGVVTFLKWKPSPVFEAGLVKVEWYWCSLTLIPAVLLTSDKISQIKNKWPVLYYIVVLLVLAAIAKSCIFLWGWK